MATSRTLFTLRNKIKIPPSRILLVISLHATRTVKQPIFELFTREINLKRAGGSASKCQTRNQTTTRATYALFRSQAPTFGIPCIVPSSCLSRCTAMATMTNTMTTTTNQHGQHRERDVMTLSPHTSQSWSLGRFRGGSTSIPPFEFYRRML